MATIESALKSAIGFPIPSETIEISLINADLDASAQYSKDHQREIDLCAAGLIYYLLTSPDIEEGDFGRKVPSKEKLELAYNLKVDKWGAPNLLNPKTEEPTVTGASVW